ncbi:hypothetical protein ABWH93_11750 [Seohaeicola saemankumensis]|jgi:hypothetical protein|uniref:hypothetical protein n=1 Tax=Seohaeicola saemankumensis TaxID=481181 RepID=UPI0035D03D90
MIIGLEKPIPINDFLGVRPATGFPAKPFKSIGTKFSVYLQHFDTSAQNAGMRMHAIWT